MREPVNQINTLVIDLKVKDGKEKKSVKQASKEGKTKQTNDNYCKKGIYYENAVI